MTGQDFQAGSHSQNTGQTQDMGRSQNAGQQTQNNQAGSKGVSQSATNDQKPAPGSAAALGYKFGAISDKLRVDTIPLKEHSLNFDEIRFLKLLAGSISLSKEEKKKIIEAIPKLSQFQIDELIKILEEEKRKFRELNDKHLDQLMKLENKHCKDWEDLMSDYVAITRKEEDKSKADDIRKQLGL